MRNHTQESGQAALMATLSITLVFGMLGLAVDLGWAYYHQQTAQAAADAAAQAAVRAALNTSPGGPTCGTGIYCGAVTNCPASAPVSPTTSFDNACILASANGFTTLGIDAVSMQAGTAQCLRFPGRRRPIGLRCAYRRNLPALFGSVMARGGFSPSARATAGAFAAPGAGSCIYVLDPSAANAFQAGNGASVQVGCGIYVDSSNKSPQAMYVTGGANVQANFISVVGGFTKDNNGTTSVVPTTGAASVPDPFASLPSPAVGTCSSGNFTAWQASPYTPAPGCYNGFTVANGMSLVMSPGVYVVNGGTFSIQGGSTVTATGGVTIYLTGGATVNIANGSSVTLSAQTSGSYQGVLFYQDRTMASPGTSFFAGGANMKFTGSLYFPHALLNIDNGTNTAGSTMALVVDKVNFQGARICWATPAAPRPDSRPATPYR